MGITQTYNFDNIANFNLSNTQITGSKAKLALVANPEQVFSEDFADDTGFTYDSAKTEFTGGILRQKDQTPNSSKLGATFTSSLNISWNKDAGLTSVLNGFPTLVSGKLDCTGPSGSVQKGIYVDTLISAAGAFKFKYTPNYTTAPNANSDIISVQVGSTVNDRLLLFNSPSGNNLRITLYNVAGGLFVSATAIGGSWTPTSGQEYEFELNYDSSAGTIRLFIDGVLHGTLSPGPWSRGSGAGRLYIGAGVPFYNLANASFDDVISFNSVQHTTGYTPGYSVSEYIYVASEVDGPNFAYSGVGTVLSVDDGSVTEVGLPRYTVGGKYWNGSAWAASNGTYAQSNDFSTALANFGTFDTGGGGILPWSVVFNDSNSISSVDAFSVEVTGQKYSPTGYIEPAQALQVSSLLTYVHTITETASAFLGVILKIDGVLTYWDGAAWSVSDGSIGESNTAAEVLANVDELILGSNSSIYIRWVLSTSSNIETSDIETATISYDFGAVETALSTCIVFGYLKDITDSPIVGATIKFELNQKTDQYKEANNNLIHTSSVSVTTDADGYFSSPLVRSSEYEDETFYLVSIIKDRITISKSGTSKLSFQVPDSETKDITDLLA